jgi:hypothetical protein
MSKLTLVFVMLSTLAISSASADIISTCTHGEKTRVISVVYLEPGSKVPCEVQYQKSQSSQVLWSATNSTGYCEKKAALFVEKQINWGWQCEETNTGVDVLAQAQADVKKPSENTEQNIKNDLVIEVEKTQIQTEKQKEVDNQKVETKRVAKQKLKTQVKQTNKSADQQQLSEAIQSVEIVKEMVEEYYNTYGEYPSDFDQLGVQQSDMQSKELMKSVIVLEKGYVAISGINKSINRTVLMPRPIPGELIHEWNCQTNIKIADQSVCQYNPSL